LGWTDDSAQLEVDAVARMDVSGDLLTTGSISVENFEDDLQVDVQFTDHSLSSTEEYMESLFEQKGSYTVGGQMVASNLDRWQR
jgi:hypothetical protein